MASSFAFGFAQKLARSYGEQRERLQHGARHRVEMIDRSPTRHSYAYPPRPQRSLRTPPVPSHPGHGPRAFANWRITSCRSLAVSETVGNFWMCSDGSATVSMVQSVIHWDSSNYAAPRRLPSASSRAGGRTSHSGQGAETDSTIHESRRRKACRHQCRCLSDTRLLQPSVRCNWEKRRTAHSFRPRQQSQRAGHMGRSADNP